MVGFIGECVSNAAAIHISDVGISIGTAVDFAKEAADIILLSKDLEVLISGIMNFKPGNLPGVTSVTYFGVGCHATGPSKV